MKIIVHQSSGEMFYIKLDLTLTSARKSHSDRSIALGHFKNDIPKNPPRIVKTKRYIVTKLIKYANGHIGNKLPKCRQ